jgi:long-chain acyl-CoA synthetase
VAAASDPVAAVLDAHERGLHVALRTSGTSGRPRSVVRTTDSWFDSFEHVSRLLGVDAGSRVWLPGPLTATMNLFAGVHAAHAGAAVSTSRGDATHAVLTPAALTRALSHDVDLSGVHVLVAGDRLGPVLRDAALGAGAAGVSHYYGAAELSFVAWGTDAEDLRPFPGVEVDCRDGVLWVRSPYLCLRYDGPDGPMTRDADGFATVEDRGHLVDGLVTVHGRGSDTVVTAGATVLVAEVESALEAVTGTSLAVVGVPHAHLGQVLCAVVTDPDDGATLRAAARRVLEPAQRPRRWFATARLPVTSAGKLDRDRLRAMVEASEGVRVLV